MLKYTHKEGFVKILNDSKSWENKRERERVRRFTCSVHVTEPKYLFGFILLTKGAFAPNAC
jgi:hypothetical protein